MNDMANSSLIDRVRKRRFVQWIVAYIAAAWVTLQAAELLFDIFGFADSGLRRLTVALIFGCAIVAVLAWYHGEKGQQRASKIEILIIAILVVSGGIVVTGDRFGMGDPDTQQQATSPFADMNSRRLTADPQFDSGPSWSPNSQSLVFAASGDGNVDIWTADRDGSRVRLTTHAAEDAQPDWSPDGRTILFVSSRNHGDTLDRSVFFGYTFGGDIWSIPAFGGTATRVVESAFNPDWSPDGARFTYDSSESGARRIWSADADGSNATIVSSDPADLAAHIRPAWSPDGEWIVFERQTGSQASEAALMLVSADGKVQVALTDGSHRDMAPAWASPGTIVFSSDRGGAINLWQLELELPEAVVTGPPVRITRGAGEDFQAAVAGDGTLAYVSIRRLENLWEMEVDPQTLEFSGKPRRLVAASWNDISPALSSDNSRTAFSSDRTGELNIWLVEADGQPEQLTHLDGQDLQPVWSPDDSMIAFFSNARGNNDIYVVTLDGGNPVPVTPAQSNDVNPYWSSDGKRFGFTSDRSGQSEVWVMNIDGSGARRLTDIGTIGHTARWSPDDQWLLFTSVSSGDRDVWMVSQDGNELRRVTEAPTQDAHGLWSADGEHILYLSDHQQLFAVPRIGGEHRLLYDPGETIDYVHLSTDGRVFQFTRESAESDIWLIE